KSAVGVSDFKVKGTAYFGDTAASDLNNISISDPKGGRYLGDLKYVVTYEGISPAYVRVRILEQWIDKNSDTIKDTAFTDYTCGKKAISGGGIWYDNRKQDYCYYYQANKGMFQPDISASSEGAITSTKKEVVLFDGVDMTNITASDENTELKLIIQVEAVQPNRFREFFKMDKMPWQT
ncbi:MAG: hypothetical protein RR361_01135, partial [Anaerovorax sp.]